MKKIIMNYLLTLELQIQYATFVRVDKHLQSTFDQITRFRNLAKRISEKTVLIFITWLIKFDQCSCRWRVFVKMVKRNNSSTFFLHLSISYHVVKFSTKFPFDFKFKNRMVYVYKKKLRKEKCSFIIFLSLILPLQKLFTGFVRKNFQI